MNYIVKKISEVDQNSIHSFYKEVYPDRYKKLTQYLKWYYRIGFENNEPIVLLDSNKVVGHLGFLPVKIRLNESIISANWYIDLIIHPSFQGKGLGSILVKEGQNFSKIQIAFANEAALKVYQKLNWTIKNSSKRLARPINPIKWVPFIKNFQINFIKNLYNLNLLNKLKKSEKLKVYNLKENKKILNDTFFKKRVIHDNNLTIYRDEDWVNWRLIEFPEINDLYIFELNDNFIITHLFTHNNIKRLNILMYYYLSEPKETEIIFSLTKWALENNVDLLWTCLTNSNLTLKMKDVFPKRFIKPIDIAISSTDKSIANIIKNKELILEGIDSDFDNLFLF